MNYDALAHHFTLLNVPCMFSKFVPESDVDEYGGWGTSEGTIYIYIFLNAISMQMLSVK